jgi:hypothetical protein
MAGLAEDEPGAGSSSTIRQDFGQSRLWRQESLAAGMDSLPVMD